MNIDDLGDYVEHFRERVLQDALTEATAVYWNRRAETFEAAIPRPGDYTGHATAAEVRAQRDRLIETAAACRAKAQIMLGGDT